MYLFLWEFGSYRQLSRLRSDLVMEVEGELNGVMTGAEAKFVAGEQGARLYAADPAGEGAPQLMSDAVVRLLAVFQRYQSELAGYGAVVDRGQDRSGAAFRRLQALVRGAPDDEAIWLTDPVATTLAPYISIERGPYLAKLVGGRESGSSSAVGAREIAAHAPAVERVLDLMDPWLWGDSSESALLLSGLRAPSDLFVVEAALERLFGGAREWFRIGTQVPERSWRYSFATEVDEGFLPRVTSFLSTAESEVWERTRGYIDAQVNSSAGDDAEDRVPAGFASAYKLYWNARLRDLRQRGLPSILVVREADVLPTTARTFIEDLLWDGEPHATLVIATLSPASDGSSPFASLEPRSADLPPLEPMEIAEAARRNLSESEIRRFRVALAARKCQGDPLTVHHHLKNLELDEGVEPHEPEDREPGARSQGAGRKRALSAESMRFVERMPEAARDLLFLCDVLQGLGSVGLITMAAADLGYDEMYSQARLHDLVVDGFLADVRSCRLHRCLDPSIFSKDASSRYATVKRTAAERLSLLYRSGMRTIDRGVYRLIEAELGEGERRRTASRLFERLLYRSNLGACADLLSAETARLKAVPSRVREPHRHGAMLATWRLRLALAGHDPAAAAQAFQELPGPTHESWTDGELYRASALYSHAQGDVERSVTAIKRSVVAYQSIQDDLGIAISNVEYSRFLLGRGAVLEALEQLNRGRIGPSKGDGVRAELHRAVVDAVASFVYGNFTRADESVSWLLQELADEGQRETYLFAVLLKGRLLFELGSYDEAERWFGYALAEARRLGHREAFSVFEAWQARSAAYLGDTEPARRRLDAIDSTPETLLFLAETQWLANEPEEALRAIERASELSLTRRFIVPERFDWTTGFSSLEEQLVPGRNGSAGQLGVLESLVQAFHAFLMGWYDSADPGIPTLRNLTRGEARRSFDPYAG
ncbi:MAG: hypothetical protein GVY29_01670, partial [Spirochaetes bacterium]|nr:hypothetical protein [Spirochaetota bacterium]